MGRPLGHPGGGLAFRPDRNSGGSGKRAGQGQVLRAVPTGLAVGLDVEMGRKERERQQDLWPKQPGGRVTLMELENATGELAWG